MYRRPKSLEALLAIRSQMSEETGHDMRAFVEMIRTGELPGEATRTVTREAGTPYDDVQIQNAIETPTEIKEERTS